MQVPKPVTTFYLQDGTSVEFPLKTAINSEDVEDYKESLVRVYLAQNVTLIDNKTFNDCLNLTQITIMNKDVEVGSDAYIFPRSSTFSTLIFNGTFAEFSSSDLRSDQMGFYDASFFHPNLLIQCSDQSVRLSEL